MRIFNHTPHRVRCVDENGNEQVFEPEGIVPRVSQTSSFVRHVNGVDLWESCYGEVQDLPEAHPDTFLIVSAIVKIACPARSDLLSPGELIRDSEGKVVGCKGLRI